jgi:hypothetical protein
MNQSSRCPRLVSNSELEGVDEVAKRRLACRTMIAGSHRLLLRTVYIIFQFLLPFMGHLSFCHMALPRTNNNVVVFHRRAPAGAAEKSSPARLMATSLLIYYSKFLLLICHNIFIRFGM